MPVYTQKVNKDWKSRSRNSILTCGNGIILYEVPLNTSVTPQELIYACVCLWGMHVIIIRGYSTKYNIHRVNSSLINNPVKMLLQDLPRKGPFFLHSCKIL